MPSGTTSGLAPSRRMIGAANGKVAAMTTMEIMKESEMEWPANLRAALKSCSPQ